MVELSLTTDKYFFLCLFGFSPNEVFLIRVGHNQYPPYTLAVEENKNFAVFVACYVKLSFEGKYIS